MRQRIIITLGILLALLTQVDMHTRPALATSAGSHVSTANGTLAGTLVLPHALIGAITAARAGTLLLAGGTYMVPTSDAAALIPAYPAGSEWAISRDGGRTWATHISTADPYKGGSLTPVPWVEGSSTWPVQFRANGVTINPRNTAEMWAVGCTSPEQQCLQAHGGHMVLHTTDGGRSWRDALVFTVPSVGTITKSNVHTNVRMSPDLVTALQYGGSTPTEAFSLLIDPRDSRRVVVAVSGLGALRSTNDGASWEFTMNPGVGVVVTFTELARDPAHPTVLYEQERAGKLYRSTDGGTHWRVQSALASQLHSGVNSLVIDGTTLYVTASVGILASRDNGATWRVLYVAPKAPGGLLGSVRLGSGWVSAFVSQRPQVFPDGLYAPTGPTTWRQVAATDTPMRIIQGVLDLQGMESAMDTRLWAVGPAIFTAAELGGLYRIG